MTDRQRPSDGVSEPNRAGIVTTRSPAAFIVEEAARRLCAASRAAQGLPPTIEDLAVLDDIAELLGRTQ
jgi:hypothetical protein